MKDFHHMIPNVDWEEIPAGEKLTKLVAVDKGSTDYTVEIHGFYDDNGKLYITNEIIKKEQPV